MVFLKRVDRFALNGQDNVAADGEPSLLLHRAAAEVGEIIPEDTGVDDTPHSELYVDFANYLLGDDRWARARATLVARVAAA